MKKYPKLCSYLSIINHGIIMKKLRETKVFTLHFYTIIISSIQNCRSSVSSNTVCRLISKSILSPKYKIIESEILITHKFPHRQHSAYF